MKARELMNTKVAAVPANWTLEQAAEFFNEEQIHGTPVVDGEGFLIGVVSKSDLVRVIGEDYEDLGDGGGQNAVDMPVTDLMSTSPVVATENDDVFDLAEIMLSEGVQRILICDDRVIQGIVSTTDLLRAMVKMAPAMR